jgi:hypothetical protein
MGRITLALFARMLWATPFFLTSKSSHSEPLFEPGWAGEARRPMNPPAIVEDLDVVEDSRARMQVQRPPRPRPVGWPGSAVAADRAPAGR